jgi:hypothetical protein
LKFFLNWSSSSHSSIVEYLPTSHGFVYNDPDGENTNDLRKSMFLSSLLLKEKYI